MECRALESSEESLRLALERDPHDSNLHNNLGIILERNGELPQAAHCFSDAVRLRPRFHEAWVNLANVKLHAGEPGPAIACCEEAIRLCPTYASAFNTLGAALIDLQRIDDALAAFRSALALRPDHAQAHANYGMALLRVGDFANGWREYEWRRKLSGPFFQRPGPAWDGSDPFGQTLFLYGEGGIGNVIQFVRYVPILRGRGARIALECHTELVPILRGIPGIWQLVARGQPLPHYDFHCPLASLPFLLGTTSSTIPAEIPYIGLDPESAAKWFPAVHRVPGFRVGVCWRGDPRTFPIGGRCFEPGHLLATSRIPGVSLISLQHGQPPPEGLSIWVLPGLEPHSMQLEDAAAVIQHLDLIITYDTAIAHLAGALGKEVWTVTKYGSCWRWMLDRDDSPWYPTMRLFRQSRPGDWSGIFEVLSRALRQRLAQ